jgi:hypothetical protein
MVRQLCHKTEWKMLFAGEKRKAGTAAEPDYRTFLLRCWRESGAGPDNETVWRFCLVEPGNGETERGFASLEMLLAHLRRELEIG